VQEALDHLAALFRTQGLFRGRFACYDFVILVNAETAEALLSSNQVLQKAIEYTMFKPWLNTGLLTSEPKKWKKRRKLLTPSFHFRILKYFISIIDFHSNVLVEKLKNASEEAIDLVKCIPLAMLDTICETAMGVSLEAQKCQESEYINAVLEASELLLERFFRLDYISDFLYFRTKAGKRFKQVAELMRNFTLYVINKRKKSLIEERQAGKTEKERDTSIFFGSTKKKTLFMDLLLQLHLETLKPDGSSDFNLEDIREEVDTFMFEGFDTTSSAITK
ncbi:Cytochrome P450 4V2-like protein, partial [Dinothrombium tinctorium]